MYVYMYMFICICIYIYIYIYSTNQTPFHHFITELTHATALPKLELKHVNTLPKLTKPSLRSGGVSEGSASSSDQVFFFNVVVMQLEVSRGDESAINKKKVMRE